ncbi:MAG TPA: hypothetical protein VJ020_06805 [Anaerolineales bacterium]|nr:hypothetical protein [Anaerolineales bacterium]
MPVADRSVAYVQQELANALGVDIARCPDDTSRHQVLLAAFESQPQIVFFDDVREGFDLTHCLPPETCPVLVTSRRASLPGVPARNMKQLGVMTAEQARELLESERLGEALNREPEAANTLIEKLCARHPLALRLAAGRLWRRLNHSAKPVADFIALQLLEALHERDDPMESVRVNSELSYVDLSETGRAHFRRLSVFSTVSGFTPEAAGAVWGLNASEADRALGELEDASLVSPAEHEGRFVLHDLLREYAAAKSRAEKDYAEANRAHAKYLVELYSKYH